MPKETVTESNAVGEPYGTVVKLPFGINGIPAALTNAGVSGLFMLLFYQGYGDWRQQIKEDRVMFREEIKNNQAFFKEEQHANQRALSELASAMRETTATVKDLATEVKRAVRPFDNEPLKGDK